MPRRVRLWAALTRIVPLVITMTATTAWAVVSGVIVTPAQIVIGHSFNCKADETNNQDPVQSYKWEAKRWFDGGCESAWVALGTANNQDFSSSVPCKIQAKLTVAYKKLGPGHNPPAPTTHPKDIVIAKADSVVVLQGHNTPVANGQAVQLVYQVKSGNNDCGGFLAGTAQEILTDQVLVGMPIGNSPWQPVAASPTFRLVAGRILDEHAEILSPQEWNSINVGDPIRSATQELRIVWSDSCGVLHFDQTLGSVSIVHRKISTGKFPPRSGESMPKYNHRGVEDEQKIARGSSGQLHLGRRTGGNPRGDEGGATPGRQGDHHGFADTNSVAPRRG